MTWRRWLWAPTIGAMIAAAGLLGFVLGHGTIGPNGSVALPILGRAPDYTMTNQLGQTVSSSRFHGKVQLVSFLFPYCTTMCPLIAAHLANLENLGLRPAGIANKVQIVSFNIDPVGTGPQQMRAFLSEYGWNPKDPHWQYLTGSPADIQRVVKHGFSVWYKKVGADADSEKGSDGPAVEQPEVVNKLAEAAQPNYDIVHDDVLEVVDQQGRIRKVYDNADEVGWTDLLRVVQSLASQPG